MLTMERTVYLNVRTEGFAFLQSIFLTLPDKNFVKQMMGLKFDHETDESTQLLRQFIMDNKLKPIELILQELAVDRAQLLRGMSPSGPRPPYESLYVNQPPQKIAGQLMDFYNHAGVSPLEEIHESPEYIGMELAFMHDLSSRELEAVKVGDLKTADQLHEMQNLFLKEHLGKWAGLFADEMFQHAKTDFYRGISLLLKDLG